MADDQKSRGRARGRGRGNQPQAPLVPIAQQMQQLEISGSGSGSSPSSPGHGATGGNGDGNGNGQAAIRGRGGFKRFELVTRPPGAGVGNSGTEIPLVTNYFRLLINPRSETFQYHATFEPEDISAPLKRRMIARHGDLFQRAYIYDGDHTIFSTVDAGVDNEFVDQGSAGEGAPEVTVKVNIKRTRVIPTPQQAAGQGGDVRETQEMVRICNTQLRRFMHRYLKMVQIGRHMFAPDQKINIPQHHIDVWAGFVTSIDKHFHGILLCADPVYKVVRTDNALDMLKKIRNEYRDQFKDEAIKQVVGGIVMTNYNNKTYRIDDIDWKSRPTDNMPDSSQTYMDYYSERYGVQIKDPNQPLLIAKWSDRDIIRMQRRTQQEHTPRPALLIPELCLMTGLSESMRNDNEIKKAMAIHTKGGPSQRAKTCIDFMAKLTGNPEVAQEMNRWGTRYNNRLTEVKGRVLPYEKVLTRDDTAQTASYIFDHKQDDFIGHVRSRPLRSSVPLNNWVIIATQRDAEHAEKLQNTMRRVTESMQIQLRKPQIRLLPNNATKTFIDEGRKLDPNNVDMVVIVSPDDKAERYSALKKLFCCDLPILSQVVLSRNVRKPSFMSICTKIAIQMACKMGGEAWAVHIPARGIMVVGFDTYHDTQSSGKKRSVGGFVCSINPDLTKWYSRVNFHTTAKELSEYFVVNMKAGLKRYHEVNGRLPDWIVVYRDGVGEGQIEEVHTTERADIQKAIKEIGQSIKLTFIIVSKRINTRFYRQGPNNQYANPPPGTVVDTVVTRVSRYDFYLVSQSVRQGTVAPTNFNIIHDDSEKTANIHQMLAYKMTHLYYNWPGTIRVPAPCQYAHKLAFLTGTALHKEPHIRLASTLFYL